MEQPNASEIAIEAIEYLAEYDANGSPYHDRSADAIADFLLEEKFARDEECDWPEDFCHEYFEAAKAALIAAGVAA